jgi:antitoxin PrlF
MYMEQFNGSSEMREILSTVTQRGQVTIPAEVRRLLGTKTGDKVAFQIEDGHVRLAPATMTLESAFSSVHPIGRPKDFKQIEREAKEAHVARQVGKSQRPGGPWIPTLSFAISRATTHPKPKRAVRFCSESRTVRSRFGPMRPSSLKSAASFPPVPTTAFPTNRFASGLFPSSTCAA